MKKFKNNCQKECLCIKTIIAILNSVDNYIFNSDKKVLRNWARFKVVCKITARCKHWLRRITMKIIGKCCCSENPPHLWEDAKQ